MEETARPVLEIEDLSDRVVERKYVLQGGPFETLSIDDFLEYAIFRKELGTGANSVSSLYQWQFQNYVVRFMSDIMDFQQLENEIRIYETLQAQETEYCLRLVYADISCGHLSNSYFVFAHEEGYTLREYMDTQEAISLEFVYHLSHHLKKAVQQFHALGILHRDIKPDNIFLKKDTWMPCIFDFTDALFLSDSAIQSPQSEYVGSPLYSHPHVLAQRGCFHPVLFKPEYDMYAIGIILREDVGPRVRRAVDRQEVLNMANYFLDPMLWDLVGAT